jgi:hypothetical protein
MRSLTDHDDLEPTFPMGSDHLLGDGGNCTVYERPDGSRYALDKHGRGEERSPGDPVFGRARFDSRDLASGRWPGSLSTPPLHGDDEKRSRRARPHRAG